jgi:zinc protease
MPSQSKAGPLDRVTIFGLRPYLRLRLLVVAVVAACLWIPLSAGQQSRPAAAASTSSGPLAAPAALATRTLPNGLQIVVFEDHSVPLVTVELAIRNGSLTETPELNGLSHLYEHMFFKTNRAEGADYMKTIDQLGISYNGTTREEESEYFMTTTTPNFPVAMRFLRDAARYPAFDAQDFEQERQAVLGEIDRNQSNPYGAINIVMNQRLFYQFPTRKNPLGTRETVKAATTDLMRVIQGRYFVPQNAAVIVTGDASPDAAFLAAQELFSDWPRRPRDPFDEFPLVEHPPLKDSEAAILKGPVQTVVVEVGWQGPSVGKDDISTYAADVFSFILRQPNSRFQRKLVDSGLVTAASLGYYTQRNVGPINLLMQTSPDRVREAIRTAYDELAHFTDPDYFTNEELESAKTILESEDLFDREKPSEYAHTISFWWASAGLDYFRGYLPRLRAISRADIVRYVTTYVQNKPHVGLALLSEEAAKASGLTEDDLIGPRSRPVR